MVHSNHASRKYKISRIILHCNSHSIYHIIIYKFHEAKFLQSAMKDCFLQSKRKHMKIRVCKILRLTDRLHSYVSVNIITD